MADRPKVLIVASDQAMRRSLAFVLEAEGYAVVAMAQLDADQPGQDGQACVAVVDQDALAARKDPAAELARLNRPVILLVERMRRPPLLPGLRIIEKPPLGRDLLDAVAGALESVRAT
jgi:CheY-like chemotaxis protein